MLISEGRFVALLTTASCDEIFRHRESVSIQKILGDVFSCNIT